MPKLTKIVVDRALPRDSQYTLWCSELKGFGVFVLPSGTRTYFVDYRNANNVRRRMKLGRHGVITAEQARTLAIQALADVAKGNDPLENRNSARKAITVKELCELYIKELDEGRILGKGGRPKKATTKGRKLGKVPPKYRNPANKAETWTGRGKQPLWLAAQIKKGKKIEEFLIK